MEFQPPLTITTQRLKIRPIAVGDLAALFEVNGDDAVTRYLPYASWATKADGEAWYARMLLQQAAGEALQYVVVDAAGDKVIGTALLFRFDLSSARAELGYVLGRAHWGRGLMHEALDALLQHAFTAMRLRRIEAQVDPRNAASARAVERLGFQHEGLLRQRYVGKGETKDVCFYGLLRDEWAIRRGDPAGAVMPSTLS